MKKMFILVVMFVSLCAVTIAAAEPMLVWDASAGATGYIIYGANSASGVTQANPMLRVDVSNVMTYPVMQLNTPPGEKYYFAVSAYNSVGESPLSNIVDWTRPEFTPPANITLPPVEGPATVTITIQVN